MKLAEALIRRRDIQNRIQELRERLAKNALVQEGEAPAEDPKELLKELDILAKQLEELIARINLTNANIKNDGVSITEMLARRECLSLKISLMQSFLSNASSTVMRGSRNEVKIYSSVDVRVLRKEVDELSQELRQLDTSIQALNWTIDLE